MKNKARIWLEDDPVGVLTFTSEGSMQLFFMPVIGDAPTDMVDEDQDSWEHGDVALHAHYDYQDIKQMIASVAAACSRGATYSIDDYTVV